MQTALCLYTRRYFVLDLVLWLEPSTWDDLNRCMNKGFSNLEMLSYSLANLDYARALSYLKQSHRKVSSCGLMATGKASNSRVISKNYIVAKQFSYWFLTINNNNYKEIPAFEIILKVKHINCTPNQRMHAWCIIINFPTLEQII